MAAKIRAAKLAAASVSQKPPTPKPLFEERKTIPVDKREPGDSPIWCCLRVNNLAGCEGLLAVKAAKVSQREPNFGWTPALFAASRSATAVLGLLLNKKAAIDDVCLEGNTALSLAARSDHLQVVELLLTQKADVAKQNKNGWNPLHWAAMNGHSRVARGIIAARVDINVVDTFGRTACMWAAKHGHKEMIEALLEEGSLDFTLRDQDGMSAIEHAEYHLELRATLVFAEELNRRILDSAQRNDAESVRRCVEAKAGVEGRDLQGWTPLMWAVLHDSHAIAEILVTHGAHPCLIGAEADLAAEIAAGNLAISEELEILLGANDRLITAAQQNDWTSARAAVQRGAYRDLRGAKGMTALMWAARNSSLEGVASMAEVGASLDLRDEGGWTAVIWGVSACSCEVVSMLHDYGADLTIKGYDGSSALHIAARTDNAVMVQLILASEAIALEETDYKDTTSLQLGTRFSCCSVVQTLLYCGANLAVKNYQERSILALAVAEGHLAVCQTLFAPLPTPPRVRIPVEPPEPSPEASDSEEDESESEGQSVTTLKEDGQSVTTLKMSTGIEETVPSVSELEDEPEEPYTCDFSFKSVIGATRNPWRLLEAAAQRHCDFLSGVLPTGRPHAKGLLSEPDMDFCMPLSLAVRFQSPAIVELLITQNAKIEAADEQGNTALMEAAKKKPAAVELVQQLLDAGARVGPRNQKKQRAVDLTNDSAVQELLRRTAIFQSMPPSFSETVVEHEHDSSRFRLRVEGLGTEDIDVETWERRVRAVMRSVGITGQAYVVDIALDPITERLRGFANVVFENARAVALALKAHLMTLPDGSVITVRKVGVAAMLAASGEPPEEEDIGADGTGDQQLEAEAGVHAPMFIDASPLEVGEEDQNSAMVECAEAATIRLDAQAGAYLFAKAFAG